VVLNKRQQTCICCNITLLYAGGHWRAALSAVSQTGDNTLLAAHVAPAAAASAEAQLAEMRADTGRIDKYMERLRQLHEKRELMAATLGELLHIW
jgi:hypothetical protein